MNLVALLGEQAKVRPNQPALVDHQRGRDRSLTFGQLHEEVTRGAGYLQQLGLRSGQTILVFQPISIELYVLLLSAFHAGMRVMLADPSAGRDFLAHCCQRLPPDAFFGPWKAHLLRLATGCLRRIPVVIRSSGWIPGTREWNPAASAPAPLCEVSGEEPALVTFTSGSTGAPKAAVRTHGFLLAQHRALAHALDFAGGEVDLVTLPVFVLANLASGLTSVLVAADLRRPDSAEPARIAGQCLRHAVNRCAASPAFFEALLKGGKELMPDFQKVYTGGAPVFPDLLERLAASLPHADVTAVFGSTEAEPMAHLAAREYDQKRLAATQAGAGLCAGRPVHEIRLKVLRDQWGTPLQELSGFDFEHLQIPAGQAGEIVVSGDHVLPGYLDGAGDEETKIHVEGGTIWHRTGDAGYLDESGLLWLLGRCAAKLPAYPDTPAGLPDGALDYPFAIESALRARFPGYRTAALGWKGQRTLAIGGEITPETTAEIEIQARALGMQKVIRLREIPLDRRHRAKVDYPELKRLLDEAPEA